ncbi:hypothetical protein CC86DRAFT_19852, partial [Ophiobolus disseminans]
MPAASEDVFPDTLIYLSAMASLTPFAKTSIILSWLLVGLAFLSTMAQLLWLTIKRSRFTVVEGCVCAALVVSISLVAQTTWAMTNEGAGRDQSDMEKRNIAAFAKSLTINEVLWSIAGALTRVSGCCLLLQLFHTAVILCWSLTATFCVCIAHGIALVIEVCLICRPLAAQWDNDIGGLCGNQMASFAAIEIIGLY